MSLIVEVDFHFNNGMLSAIDWFVDCGEEVVA